MPSDLQRVATALVECLDQMPNLVAHLQRLAAKCRENAGMITDFGSANSSARTAALQLDAAAQACERAAHMASLAPPMAKQWAEQMVSGARTVSGTGPSRDPVGGASEPTPAPFIQEIFERLPDRPNDSGPTSGILTMIDGSKPIRVVSGTKGPGAGAPGLIGKTALLDSARKHAEGHAAALMRRAGAAKEMTLYLNNKPCPGKWGCNRTLKYQLPPGAKLTIYYPGGRKVYIGEEGQPE